MAQSTSIRRALGALRMAVGVGTLLSPGVSGRIFGLGRVGDDAAAALVARLFGVRDLTLGAAVFFAPDEVRLRQALVMGVACDSVDLGSTLVGLGRGVPKAAGVLVGAGAALFVGMGIASLADPQLSPAGTGSAPTLATGATPAGVNR